MFNVTEFDPKVNITDNKKMTIQDGFVAYKFDDLYAAFEELQHNYNPEDKTMQSYFISILNHLR